jgi:predicted GIY-YIG superfamily endonuclease
MKVKNKDYRIENVEKESKRKKEYRDLQKSKPIIHHVYLLPNENYVGTTMNVVERMSKHRIVNKRNTNNYRILSSFSNREDALELEELLHNMGYDGKHINNMYK